LEVHVGEKWFFVMKDQQTIYLLPDEIPPHVRCLSKRHITKVMFLAAVSRPQWDAEGRLLWDGRVGIWPLTEEVVAQRNSKRRRRGTVYLRPCEVNKPINRDQLINQVIPAIKERWPAATARMPIGIQQDNAGPHVGCSDEAVLEAGREDNYNIYLKKQPARSPDCNVLDLGFFRSVDSVKDKLGPCAGIPDLIRKVEEAFWSVPVDALERVWVTYQACLLATMLQEGDNKYKVPHMGKMRLRSVGRMSRYLVCPAWLIHETKQRIPVLRAEAETRAQAEALEAAQQAVEEARLKFASAKRRIAKKQTGR
jgi:hypothetical protein